MVNETSAICIFLVNRLQLCNVCCNCNNHNRLCNPNALLCVALALVYIYTAWITCQRRNNNKLILLIWCYVFMYFRLLTIIECLLTYISIYSHIYGIKYTLQSGNMQFFWLFDHQLQLDIRYCISLLSQMDYNHGHDHFERTLITLYYIEKTKMVLVIWSIWIDIYTYIIMYFGVIVGQNTTQH